MKYVCLVGAALCLSACSSGIVPSGLMDRLGGSDTPAAGDAVGTQAVSVGGATFAITKNDIDTVAFVRGEPGAGSLTQMMGAVATQTGCTPTALPQWGELTGLTASDPVPAAAYSTFGGSIPVPITC